MKLSELGMFGGGGPGGWCTVSFSAQGSVLSEDTPVLGGAHFMPRDH